MAMQTTVQKRLWRRMRAEDGTATVEAVVWFPIFIAILALIIDVTLMLHGKTQVTRVVQDGTRAYAVGRITETADVEAFIMGAVSTLAPNAVALTASSGGIVSTIVKVPATDLMMFGYFSAFDDLNMAIASQQLLEI